MVSVETAEGETSAPTLQSKSEDSQDQDRTSNSAAVQRRPGNRSHFSSSPLWAHTASLPPSWPSDPASERDWPMATNKDKFVVHGEKKLFEILRLVKTCRLHCSRHHPSCSLAFDTHRLGRPFPSVALSLPLSSGVPLQGEGVDG